MLKIRSILVPTDYSEYARRAFDHARFAADRYGALLHALHVVETNVKGLSVLENKQEISEFGDLSGATTGTLQDDDVTEGPRTTFERRNAWSAGKGILDCAREIDADLIVMGTHGRNGMRRLLMGSVAEEVVHRAECPVVTVRAGGLSVPGRGISRILVPVDFSDVSRSQILHAQELAATYEAALDILHVIEVPNVAEFYRMDHFHSEVPAMSVRARQALIEFAATGGPDVPTLFHVLVGRPARDILDFAEAQKSDLIVIAMHARSGGRHMLMGGVAEQVIRRAPLLVATLKASGKSLIAPATSDKSASKTHLMQTLGD